MELTQHNTPQPLAPAGVPAVAAPSAAAWTLGSDRLQTVITSAGAGGVCYDGLAVTRTNGDLLRQAYGTFLYCRDLDSGAVWSIGWQPTGARPDAYAARRVDGGVVIARQDDGIASQLEVSITADDVEVRRCTLQNLSERPRRLEITSYTEWVLQDAVADASHPAFSKLFVETAIDRVRRGVLAKRRRRAPEQALLAGAHWIAELAGEPLGEPQFETCRMTFLGRGGSLRLPAALGSRDALAGKAGPVLDPIAACRASFFVAAGESATITLATAARDDLSAVSDVIDSFAATMLLGNEVLHESHAGNDVQRNGSPPAPLRIDRAHVRADRTAYQSAASSLVKTAAASESADEQEPLQFDNGLGGFSADGCEYVLRLRPDATGKLVLPPLPWTNIVANEQAGFIATETGAGYTWTANSRENRLTPWHNDPVLDPHGEAIYVRNRATQRYWSPTPGPVASPTEHEVRHGFGYTRYRHASEQLQHDTVAFVPRGDAVKITRVQLANLADEEQELELFAYAELALGDGSSEVAAGADAWFDEASLAVFARNARRELGHRIAFLAVVTSANGDAAGQEISHTCDPAEFLGPLGDLATPHAVAQSGRLSGSPSLENAACAALQTELRVAAASSAAAVILLGEADSEQEARDIIARYSDLATVGAALEEVTAAWRQRLARVQIETPSKPLDLMINGWLPYQNLSCRMWARSAYYQAGGAYGFRDQLQDAAAQVYHWPALTREQILRNASHQFVEGDVLHWWHPPHSRGLRTRFADDLLWLPLAAAEYCATTGDDQLWDERTPYLAGPQLEPGEDERFLAPEDAGVDGSVYEHCCRAIDRSLAVGPHGLPLMGCGDWNDGMNRIGHGGGESVWMGFFLSTVLQRFTPVCEDRGDFARARQYRTHLAALAEALNDAGWDGSWYRRAFFADGAPVGSIASEECQIDALAQAWAVLSGVAPADRAASAVQAVEEKLVSPEHGLIKLLAPPFDKSAHDPGYIRGYVPGVRENGGQYTHGVLWYIRALAEMGRGTRAAELLQMLTPVAHGDSPEAVARYQAEPYVIAADVYGVAPHEGRAGWTWYTGSAGWMFRVAVESILGLRIERNATLVLNPSISAAWPTCRLTYRPDDRGTQYEVTIENPHGREHGVARAWVDGEAASVVDGVARVPLVQDGRPHDVRVQL
ncbi:MAG: glycosyl transferase [Planctomycetaceae bacterium]|nr:glycosyl transferase [Planctomycetaceae bacterium]